MIPSTVSGYDHDIDWTRSRRMALCACEHHETSHRPISRKCSLCASCLAFTPNNNLKMPVDIYKAA